MGLIERLKNTMQQIGANTGLSKEYRSIFDVSGVPSFNEFYNIGIFPWKYLYRGFYKPWHLIDAPTIADPKHKRNLTYLNLSKAVCAELAGMVWTDQCDVAVSMAGVESDDDPLNAFVQDVLVKNNFQRKMVEAVEQAAALGGEAIKVWYETRRDSEGNEIPDTGRIRLGFAMADQFVPTQWDNATVSGGIFVTRQARGGWYYTLLEWHEWDGTTYVIRNELYRSEIKKDEQGNEQDILGFRYPLAALYPYMDEEVTVDTEKSLFTYFRTPDANNIDYNSPLFYHICCNKLRLTNRCN